MFSNFQASPCTTRTAFGLLQRMALPEGSIAAPCNTIHTRPLARHATLRGFTLVELLVVIGLLALLSVGALVAYDGVGDDARQQMVRTEMASISKALKQYRRDVGAYPERQHPADFTFLLTDRIWDGAAYDTLTEEERWDPDSARGWRGPYLDNAGNGFVSVGINLGFDGSGSPIVGAAVAQPMMAVADPFARLPDGIYFVWRPCATCDPFDGINGPEERGRPYYLFELDQPRKARLVSAGPNGLLETGTLAAANCADIYDTAIGDDIILCLQ
jgi:prepilin-type N-terminal cleavage/methylation domain-containing protein